MFRAVLLPIADRGDEAATVYRTDAWHASDAEATSANLRALARVRSCT